MLEVHWDLLEHVRHTVAAQDLINGQELLKVNCKKAEDQIASQYQRRLVQLPEDEHAKALMPGGYDDFRPLKTTGNGNCLYNGLSLDLFGDEASNKLLRAITALEMFVNPRRNFEHPYFCEVSQKQSEHDATLSPDDILLICLPENIMDHADLSDKARVLYELALDTSTDKQWSGMIHILAISNALNLTITSICPDSCEHLKSMLHVTIHPHNDKADTPQTVCLMWSRESLDNRAGVTFEPDHIVGVQTPRISIERKRTGHRQLGQPKKKKKQLGLDGFFKTTTKPTTASNDGSSADIPVNVELVSEPATSQSQGLGSALPREPEPENAASETSNASTPPQELGPALPREAEPENKNTIIDISKYNENTSDDLKYELIINRKPAKGFAFPGKVYKDKKRKSGTYKRHCNEEWFQEFDFIGYSKIKDKIYCLPCVLFPTEAVKVTKSKTLTNDGYQNWKDAKSDLKDHSSVLYHTQSDAKLRSFMTTYVQPSLRIDMIMSTETQARVAHNREILKSIIKCAELCGRQGIALRGHRDDATNLDPFQNPGNFKALINFRVDAGDRVLEEHLSSAARNATYISKTSQNDLLQCMKEDIWDQIVAEINSQPLGPLFGVQADDVTDVSNWEQEGIVIRYLKDLKPVERLVDYNNVEKTTSEVLYNALIDSLKALKLDPKMCRSQTYDGAPNMSGHTNGVSAKFLRDNPLAVYLHCNSHCLNLVLSTASKLAEIHIMNENLKSVGRFFDWPKRQRWLEETVREVNDSRPNGPKIKKERIKPMCDTRWVERHTTFEDFDDLYEPICICLQKIASNRQSWDAKSMTEASGLLNCITKPDFIAAYHVNKYVFGYTKVLSKLLQGSTQDILSAYEEVDLIAEQLKSVRHDAENAYTEVFVDSMAMATTAGLTGLAIPRICGRQTLRNNVTADDPEEYWRRVLFIPYLDEVNAQFDTRFSMLSKQAIKGLRLLPRHLNQLTVQDEADMLSFYGHGMPSPSTFSQELDRWKRKWAAVAIRDKPQNLQETISSFHQGAYPNIFYIFYSVLLTSVSGGSVERSHSALKLVKTPRRSTMGQPRLVALTLLYVHKDIKVNYEHVIDKYAKKEPRRMTLLNPVGDVNPGTTE